MTQPVPSPAVSMIQNTVRDAATPISNALQAIYEGAQGGFRVQEAAFTYSDSGVTVVASPELPTATREDLYGYFIDAFAEAEWGMSTQLNRELTYRVSVLFTHPNLLTRTGA